MLFAVKIKGLTALLQHRFQEAAEVQTNTRRVHLQERDPRVEAEKAAYRDAQGRLYMPTAAIARLLREAGGAHKQRGSRRSVKYVIPSAVLLPEETFLLTNGNASKPATDFEVDARPVTIPSTKGRIMRYRPRLNQWGGSFQIEVDEQSIEPDMVHTLLSEGGSKLGIGDYRPEKGGPFGRFSVVEWKLRK